MKLFNVKKICTSALSVLFTTSGLITEMKVKEIGVLKPIVPKRSLCFTYGQIFPLVTFGVAPRLFSLAAIGSFATLENWSFYLASFISYATLHGLNCAILSVYLRKRNKILMTTEVFIGYFTSLVAPCSILNLHSNFIVWTGISSSVLLSVGLGSMLAIANHKPSMIFQSHPSNTTLTEESFAMKTNHLEHYCMILIPLLLFSNLIYYLIRKLVTKMNRRDDDDE